MDPTHPAILLDRDDELRRATLPDTDLAPDLARLWQQSSERWRQLAEAKEREIERLCAALSTARDETDRAREMFADADAAHTRALAERDAARGALQAWQTRTPPDGFPDKCYYCHGVGACPRCWGRAGIERAIADLDAARAEAAGMREALELADRKERGGIWPSLQDYEAFLKDVDAARERALNDGEHQ